jgi:hypothetical protein
MEAVDQLLDVLVQQRVVRDLVEPFLALRFRRQFAVDQEVGDVEEGGVLGQLLDRVAAVAEDALLAVDVGDRAPAARRIQEGRVVADDAGGGAIARDLLQVGRLDRPVLQGDVIAPAGSVVDDRDRLF